MQSLRKSSKSLEKSTKWKNDDYQSTGGTIHGGTVQCSAVQCSAVQCSAVQCSAVHSIALHCIALHCIALHCSSEAAQMRIPLEKLGFPAPGGVPYPWGGMISFSSTSEAVQMQFPLEKLGFPGPGGVPYPWGRGGLLPWAPGHIYIYIYICIDTLHLGGGHTLLTSLSPTIHPFCSNSGT